MFCYTTVHAAPAERRTALVIGNADYAFSPLLNPTNDARAIAAALQQAGFKVQSYLNLDQKTMKRAILDFGRELAQNDVGLFYYAGHGVQQSGRNYLIPVDAEIQYESDIEVESVDLALVLSKMKHASNRLNIVILDACRNNPFVSSSRAINQGLAFTSAPSGTLIAYSTAPGGVADDGDGKNGIYTQYLIQHILSPNIKIEDVFKRVRIDVKKRTQGQQIPWESSSLEGDFYFLPDTAPYPSPVPQQAIVPENYPRPKPSVKPRLVEEETHNQTINNAGRTFNCSDLREKETFSGQMGFGELTAEEQSYLDRRCR